MHLRKYPFDSQSCPLELGSFGYTSSDVVYKWASSPVSMNNLQMAQYKLTSLDHGVRNENSTRWGLGRTLYIIDPLSSTLRNF